MGLITAVKLYLMHAGVRRWSRPCDSVWSQCEMLCCMRGWSSCVWARVMASETHTPVFLFHLSDWLMSEEIGSMRWNRRNCCVSQGINTVAEHSRKDSVQVPAFTPTLNTSRQWGLVLVHWNAACPLYWTITHTNHWVKQNSSQLPVLLDNYPYLY